jgi:hypothetical protein
MFSLAECKLCCESVRFALRHLKEKHPTLLQDGDVIKLNMSKIVENFQMALLLCRTSSGFEI